MGNFMTNLRKELDYYKKCLAFSLAEQNNTIVNELFYFSQEFKDAMIKDLEDKSFSTEEAKDVTENEVIITKTLAYKMLAYCYMLYNDYTTADELKDIIKNDSVSDIDFFTEKDINKILEFRKEIIF